MLINGMKREVRAVFQKLPHRVKGFLRKEEIQTERNDNRLRSMTFWTGEACKRRWHRSREYSDFPVGIPRRLTLVRGPDRLRYFKHVYF